MFNYFKKIAISKRMDDEFLYEYVLDEMESGVMIKGLWGKALANSNGSDSNAKSIYMRYRVQAIKDIFTAREIAYNELTKATLFEYIQNKLVSLSNNSTNLSNAPSKPKVSKDYNGDENKDKNLLILWDFEKAKYHFESEALLNKVSWITQNDIDLLKPEELYNIYINRIKNN